MINATDSFVKYLFDKEKKIYEPIIEKAKECKLDYMAVVTAGARKSKDKWQTFLNTAPKGNAALYGYDITTDSRTAALINGFNAHCLELDDGQRFAMIHLGASVISAIDAARSDFDISEKSYLTGIIMGYEAACRAAVAMQPSHKKKGYHTAGTCGTIGSAVGAAFALGMSEKQLKRVLTLACASSAGMLEIQEQGSELKPYNLGRAAMDGLTAAYMGYTAFETPEDMLGGARGYFRTFSDKFDTDKLIEDTGYFEIERIYVKPYASCRHSHSAVEAAIRLHDGLKVNDIDRAEVKTYELGVKGHDHTDIAGVASAKLSTPYAVAAGLLYGRADLTVFEPLDENAVNLAKKIRVLQDEELTEASSAKRVAILTLYMNDGSEKSCRVDYAKGDPENPMSKEELQQKADFLYGYSGV
jgi:2-methylcitrate dehydratase PrpD